MTAVALNETNPACIWNIVDAMTYPFLSWRPVVEHNRYSGNWNKTIIFLMVKLRISLVCYSVGIAGFKRTATSCLSTT
jgi:hypothetical protein